MRIPAVESYPTRSTDHLACAGARDLSDWLAHLRLKNRADRTLDDYERTIAHLQVEDARAALNLLELEV